MSQSHDHALKSKTQSMEMTESKNSKNTSKGTFNKTNQPSHEKNQPIHLITEICEEEVDTSRVTFNVGGVIFQTHGNTMRNIQPINHELELWGLEELDIEPCCWNNFNQGLDTANILKKLRRDAIHSEDEKIDALAKNSGYFARCRLNLWYILTVPKHSRAAKVYEWTAILLALLAIFSFCAATTALFRINIDTNNTTNNSSSSRLITIDSSTLNFSDDPNSNRTNVIPALQIIDYICLAFFTLELILLVLCAPKLRKFVFSITALIDVLAILPDYIQLIVQSLSKDDNRTVIMDLLPILRLMRVIRIFRVVTRISGLWIMIYTLKASYKDLFLMLVVLLAGTLLFGSVIYFVDDNTIFTSIPQSFWWAIVTMTTVGYGDMVPKTGWGQLVASLGTVCGVLLIGFTIPSLVNNFIVYNNLIQFDAKQKKLLALKAGEIGKS